MSDRQLLQSSAGIIALTLAKIRGMIGLAKFSLMPDLTVTLSSTAHETFTKLAQTSGETIQTVLDKAIENYRRYLFLVQANQAFLALRQNEELWQEELAERDLWNQTMADGVIVLPYSA